MKILVIGPSWVGDMVLAQSLFKALKAQHPNSTIDVFASRWSEGLLQRMPEVRRAVHNPFGHGALQLTARYRLARELRAERYDWAIVLPNSLKAALIPFWANIPRRTGYRGEFRYGLLNDRRTLDVHALPMTVQRFIALGDATPTMIASPPIPNLMIDDAQRRSIAQKFGLHADAQPILALCPGAEYGPAKRWPAEYFAAVARAKHAQGWQVWLFGSQKDKEITDRVVDLAGVECSNLAGKTELTEAIDLLSLASVVVSNDSGLMHIAAAVDRKVIAIYGSSDPTFTPPMTPHAEILRLGIECSPCFKRECPLGHLRCLRDLKPERVLRVVEG